MRGEEMEMLSLFVHGTRSQSRVSGSIPLRALGLHIGGGGVT